MEIFERIVSNVGFPIAVTGFLLIRIEKKLDILNNRLMSMGEQLLKHKK